MSKDSDPEVVVDDLIPRDEMISLLGRFIPREEAEAKLDSGDPELRHGARALASRVRAWEAEDDEAIAEADAEFQLTEQASPEVKQLIAVIDATKPKPEWPTDQTPARWIVWTALASLEIRAVDETTERAKRVRVAQDEKLRAMRREQAATWSRGQKEILNGLVTWAEMGDLLTPAQWRVIELIMRAVVEADRVAPGVPAARRPMPADLVAIRAAVKGGAIAQRTVAKAAASSNRDWVVPPCPRLITWIWDNEETVDEEDVWRAIERRIFEWIR